MNLSSEDVLLELRIAGVHFSVTSAWPVTLEETDPAYEAFRGRNLSGESDLSIQATLSFDDWPKLSDADRSFDTESSWRLYRKGSLRYLTFTRLHEEHPYLVAALDQERMSVNICCEDAAIVKKSTGVSMFANPLHYPLDQLLLMYALADKGGLIVHSAGVEIDGKIYLFAGKSGAGKSTISLSLSASTGIHLVNDDRMVLREQAGGFMAYGTPWPGEAGLALNRQAEIGGICFLSQASMNRVTPLSDSEALEALLPVSTIPWYDAELVPEMLDFCSRLIRAVPTYVLEFTPGAEVGEVLKRAFGPAV